MTSPEPKYEFFTQLARIINSGQSRSVMLSGEVNDLYHVSPKDSAREYVPLIDFLAEKCGAVSNLILLVYELNGPLRIIPENGRERLREGWIRFKSGVEPEQLILRSLSDKKRQMEREIIEGDFDRNLREIIGKPTMALEFLRQLCFCSRSQDAKGRRLISDNLLVMVEAADMLLPPGGGDISQLSPIDRQRIGITQDWFSDPGFMNGEDSVILLAESPSMIHPRVARLPQMLRVEIPSPDLEERRHFIDLFFETCGGPPAIGEKKSEPKLWAGREELGQLTAGLSIHALRQLLVGAAHSGETLQQSDVVSMVEQFIRTQLGDDVVEFKKPQHTLDDVVGFTRLKQFIKDELLPRMRSSGPDALPGAAVGGPIGGGKTFIFEAAAGALDLPVLVLKSIRSQWFGQTDVIFERLRRVLTALDKAIIFVDEADTQFGGVGEGAHETERRLTGKIQAMMSDPALRGKIIWLLMTARIHLLSPDIRRPGRVGDLIIPVLDPRGEDRREFIRWTLEAGLARDPDDKEIACLEGLTTDYSAASFASLRSNLLAHQIRKPLDIGKIEAIVRDHIAPAIEQTRRYQTLQALVNCTRRSLLPNPEVTDETRRSWASEIRDLEAIGIR